MVNTCMGNRLQSCTLEGRRLQNGISAQLPWRLSTNVLSNWPPGDPMNDVKQAMMGKYPGSHKQSRVTSMAYHHACRWELPKKAQEARNDCFSWNCWLPVGQAIQNLPTKQLFLAGWWSWYPHGLLMVYGLTQVAIGIDHDSQTLRDCASASWSFDPSRSIELGTNTKLESKVLSPQIIKVWLVMNINNEQPTIIADIHWRQFYYDHDMTISSLYSM